MKGLPIRPFVGYLLPAMLTASGVAASVSAAEPDVELWRLDCGSIDNGDLDAYSDTFAYVGESMTFTVSCYLVRSGERYLLWDTGLSSAMLGKEVTEDVYRMRLDRLLTDQLQEIGVPADQIEFLSVSHYHFDHTGQAAAFPDAKLLVDRRDWEVVQGREDLAKDFTPWISGGSEVETLTYDKDVFGDGSVMLLRTPGHTPGHRSLLVRLKDRGAVLLTGDAAHFRENWRSEGVPGFNTNRAETVASIHRLKEIADQLGATIVIGHDPDDISKLAAFPESTR